MIPIDIIGKIEIQNATNINYFFKKTIKKKLNQPKLIRQTYDLSDGTTINNKKKIEVNHEAQYWKTPLKKTIPNKFNIKWWNKKKLILEKLSK